MSSEPRDEGASKLRSIGSPSWRESLWTAIEASPSPEQARSGIERILDSGGQAGLLSCDGPRLDALAAITGSSPDLTRYLVSLGNDWPAALGRCFLENPDRDELHALGRFADCNSPSALSEALRRLANAEMLRIGSRDLLGVARLDDTVEALSALADVCVDTAVSWLREWQAREGGDVIGEDGSPIRFVVLGLGKLGGKELNYSSDIDLMFLYETDVVADGSPQARTFFTKLARAVTQALAEVTADGYVFRVDLRLRPEGNNGPIVNSLDNALRYYEGWGDTWERGALIKVRAVGGDDELADSFTEAVRPFVFRRHLDYLTVEDFRTMKERIDAEQASQAPGWRNVKLGRGGIRELEFVVVVLQLIHGGHVPEVRCRGTRAAIRALVEHELLSQEEASRLLEAYEFLRNTEHAIQVEQRRQLQRLPESEAELTLLARRLGYGRGVRGAPRDGDPLPAFETDWQRHTSHVREAFVKFMELRPAGEEEAEGPTEERASTSVAVLTSLAEGRDEDASRLLASMGFPDGEKAAATLARIYRGSFRGPASPQRRRALEAMAPGLLDAVVSCAEPEAALERLVDFLVRTGAHTSYLALLSGSPATMQLLLSLFSSSPYLTSQLAGRPELIDYLVRADAVVPERTREEYEKVLDEDLSGADDEETVVSVLRRARSAELIRIGLNDLSGAIDMVGVQEQLTLLADVCLARTIETALRFLAPRYAEKLGAIDLAVIAMGKLGAREMTYGSDLDLIFVYDSPGEGFDAELHAAAAKWVQKIIGVIQTRTADGVLYSVDARLRPSGSSGPLVTSFERFASYHTAESDLWERQALIRARVAYGGKPLAERITDVIQQHVYSTGLDEAGVEEIDGLRRRVELELAGESGEKMNIKTGRGGIVDIEFLVQMLQLRHGHEKPRLRTGHTLEAIEGLGSAGVLEAEHAATLAADYRFLRRLEARMRLERDRPVEELGTDAVVLDPLARRLGMSGDDPGEELLYKCKTVREEVRSLYDAYFSAAGATLT